WIQHTMALLKAVITLTILSICFKLNNAKIDGITIGKGKGKGKGGSIKEAGGNTGDSESSEETKLKKSNSSSKYGPGKKAVCPDVDRLTKAIDNFSVDVYKAFVKNKQTENVIFSPLSISIIMSMVMLGAEGSTLDELKRALHVGSLVEKGVLHQAYKCVNDELWNDSTDNMALAANRIYHDISFDVKATFIEDIKTFYRASVKQLDFTDIEESMEEINDWVSYRTNKLIPNILSEGDIDSLTVMVLVNAIYFKGQWLEKFDPASTIADTFFMSHNRSIQVAMMRQAGSHRYYHSSELKAQFVELSYSANKDSETVMIIVLPDDRGGLEELENTLTDDVLNTALEKLVNVEKAFVYLPRLAFKSKVKLRNLLKDIGLVDLFSGNINLNGLSDDPRMDISEIIHEAAIDIHEEGTEAMAMSALVSSRSISEPPVTVHCNHPYMLLVRDRSRHVTLFMGRVTNPEPLRTQNIADDSAPLKRAFKMVRGNSVPKFNYNEPPPKMKPNVDKRKKCKQLCRYRKCAKNVCKKSKKKKQCMEKCTKQCFKQKCNK
ncbi:unnamed protein product, partial [Owenia fusiformis]